MSITYYGEKECESFVQSTKKCTKYAYFISNNTLMCGVHSKKDKNREKLPTNPNKKQMEEDLLKKEKKKLKILQN